MTGHHLHRPRPAYLKDDGINWTDRSKAAEKAFWAPLWQSLGGDTLTNTYEARVEAAWRILRRMGWLRGILRHNERITEIGRLVNPLDASFVFQDDAEDRVSFDLRTLLVAGLPVLPPATPVIQIGPDSEPDDVLARYVEFIQQIGAYLGLPNNPRTNRGFAWFVSTRTIRLGWPPIADIAQFENKLISEVKKRSASMPLMEIYEMLDSEYRLSEDESIGIVSMAMRALEAANHLGDRQGTKARVLVRLEEFISKAQEAFDHRGAALIQREWWRVFRDEGTVGEEDFEGMAEVIQRSARSAAKSPLTELELPEDAE